MITEQLKWKKKQQKNAKCLSLGYLDNKGAKNNTAEDGVVEDAFKDVPLAVDLAGVDLIEQLHQHERVEDDGVVFRGWRVKRGVPAAVDVKQFLSCRVGGGRSKYNQSMCPRHTHALERKKVDGIGRDSHRQTAA